MKINQSIVNQRIRAELADLESRAQLRSLETACGVDFNSNDYLGLALNPQMKQAVLQAADSTNRIASTGSRLLSGHDEAWTALETEFARWVGADAALYFTSGYAANIGLLSSILRPDDIVFSDSSNHASLIDGMRLAKCRRIVFPHLNLDVLEEELRHNRNASGARVIVVESVFSMDGDRAPLTDLAVLADRYSAELIVDEAHAIGLYGPSGAGCIAEAGLSGRVLASIHTCGKALAAAGSFVCGSQQLCQFLINRARTFIFNTALPPYFAAQVAMGMRLAATADGERAHLVEISEFLRNELKGRGFDVGTSDTHVVPVILGTNETAVAVAAQLQRAGFGVRAIRPPTVAPGSARLRLSLTANFSRETLMSLIEALVHARSIHPSERSFSVLR